MVYSASNVVALHKYKDSFYFFKRQFGFWVIGMFIMFLLIKYDVRNYYKHISLVFYLYIIINSCFNSWYRCCSWWARSWIGIGSFQSNHQNYETWFSRTYKIFK